MKRVVILLFIIVFLLTGCSVKKANEVTDAEIFASEYAISKDHAFKYASLEEIFSLLENGTGILFFGNSDQEDSLNVVKMFSRIVEVKKVEKVHYYNPIVIRDDKTADYDRLTSLLGDNITVTENGDSYLEVPSVYFIKDGEIIGYSAEASKIHEIEDDKLNEFYVDLEKSYLELIDKYLSDESIE